jgi:plastocyanin
MLHRLHIGFVVWALAAVLVGPSCKDKGDAAPSESAQPQTGSEPAAPSGHGTITGVVTFTGEMPAMPVLDRASDPMCAKESRTASFVAVGDEAALRDVAVRIPAGAASGEAPDRRPRLDQRDCVFEPSVIAVVRGQELEIANSDPTYHIAHGVADGRGVFTGTQAEGAPVLVRTIKAAPGVIKVSCNIHPWMLAHVVVSDHPYIAVTPADGTFTLRDVPVGKYELEAWHPHLGTRTAAVVVSKDETATADFAFDANDYKEPVPGR